MKLVLLVLALSAGCSSAPVPPTITGVDAPMTAMAGQKITLGVHFQDPDDAVTAVKIYFPSTGQGTSTVLPMPVFGDVTIQVGISFPPQTPKGPFEIDISLVDQSVLESAQAQVMVTIQ